VTTTPAIAWFKNNFAADIHQQVNGTPFPLDFITAIALQESCGDAWKFTYTTLPKDRVLEVCVGDTLDSPSRDPNAFPQNRAALEASREIDGRALVALARQALVDIAHYNPGCARAAQNPDKFVLPIRHTICGWATRQSRFFSQRKMG
jgi:hypothetical protein